MYGGAMFPAENFLMGGTTLGVSPPFAVLTMDEAGISVDPRLKRLSRLVLQRAVVRDDAWPAWWWAPWDDLAYERSRHGVWLRQTDWPGCRFSTRGGKGLAPLLDELERREIPTM